jgi:hypothetical protein
MMAHRHRSGDERGTIASKGNRPTGDSRGAKVKSLNATAEMLQDKFVGSMLQSGSLAAIVRRQPAALAF